VYRKAQFSGRIGAIVENLIEKAQRKKRNRTSKERELMVKANSAKVEWDSAKKRWEVHIEVGSEVIKRPIEEKTVESGDDAIRSAAVAIANDEGYQLDPASVQIVQLQ
jgi:flagellar biosynthesis component FlhA